MGIHFFFKQEKTKHLKLTYLLYCLNKMKPKKKKQFEME